MSNSTQSLDQPRYVSMKPLLVVAAHSVLWGVWLLVLFSFAPRYENMYRRINLRLPEMSEMVLSLAHGFIPSALLLVLFFVAIDGAVYYRLRQAIAQRVWSGLMTGTAIAVIFMTVVAICLPALKLVEGFAG
jgi:type II secretory pathway component PulF